MGFGVHLINGWILAFVYAAAFQSWRLATWWLGSSVGLVHVLVRVADSHAYAAWAPPAESAPVHVCTCDYLSFDELKHARPKRSSR